MEQRASDIHRIASRAEYRAWAEEQVRGRTERVRGDIISMVAERIGHVRVKQRVWSALDQAVRAAGLPCEALTDGVTIEVDDDTDYEPDAVVECGERLGANAVAAVNPVIVVEVFSPSTQHIDTGIKLLDYFRLPSIRHYLTLQADRRRVIHHRRDGDAIATRLLSAGRLSLDPPGLVLDIDAIYAGLP